MEDDNPASPSTKRMRLSVPLTKDRSSIYPRKCDRVTQEGNEHGSHAGAGCKRHMKQDDIANADAEQSTPTGKAEQDDPAKAIPVHGNYKGYYTKRRFGQDPYAGDERLALLPKEWLQDKKVLDIGCNEGKVTIEIAQNFRPYSVVGVDIDGELIRIANRQARVAWSTQEPVRTITNKAKVYKDRSRRDYRRDGSSSPEAVDAKDAFVPSSGYFPKGLPCMFGYLPEVTSKTHLQQRIRPSVEESRERNQRREGKLSRSVIMPKEVWLYPINLSFKRADWVMHEISSDRLGYDCILALSVSKWIHLNGGDEGIMEFFTRVFTTLLPSGRFVLEAQPWASYAKAQKMAPCLREAYQTIKIRPEDFERILLSEIGFRKVEKLADEGRGGEDEDLCRLWTRHRADKTLVSTAGFERSLNVYIKAAGSWL